MTKQLGPYYEQCSYCEKEFDTVDLDIDDICPGCRRSSGRNTILLIMGAVLIIIGLTIAVYVSSNQ